MHVTSVIPTEKVNVRVKLVRTCTHSRVVDEVRDADGVTTGRLVCLECHAEFPDPTYAGPHH